VIEAALVDPPLAPPEPAPEPALLPEPSARETAAAPPDAPRGRPIPAPERNAAPYEGDAPDRNRLVELLDGVGFPTGILAPLLDTVLAPQSVDDAFALIGPTPTIPRARGSLLAVIAPVGEALPLARSLAAGSRIDPNSVALIARPKSPTMALPASNTRGRPLTASLPDRRPADGLVATDITAVRALGGGWRRDRIGIVAIELDGRSHAFVRSALRSLMPSAVWMSADARMKNEDLIAQADAVGGIDALMLAHADETSTPAIALRAGFAVATLNGHHADPARWTRIVNRVAERR
jgi:hypothetical protein